jgi:hypothetical protein
MRSSVQNINSKIIGVLGSRKITNLPKFQTSRNNTFVIFADKYLYEDFFPKFYETSKRHFQKKLIKWAT